MNLEKNNSRKLGKIVGFILMYFVFTTIFYFVLNYFEKLPENFNFFYMLNLTLSFVLIGSLLKITLK
jgi:hypothetical protein